jgi:nucleoside-diphosphate-sugar epimerase
MQPLKVIVTGGTGFLGGHVMAALLAAGHNPIAYDLTPPGPDMIQVVPLLAERFRRGSVCDADAVLDLFRAWRPDAIVHAGARLGQKPSLADPASFYQTNIMGLVNVCEAARKFGVGKLVMVSSNAVYHGPSGDRLVETDLPFSVSRANPAAHYGTSKMAGEAIGLAYAEFHGIDFLALRVSAIYGFGMRSPLLLKPMVENGVLGLPTRLPTGGPMKRDYTHVLDCSRAILLATEASTLPPHSQRVLNVAAGNLRSGAEIADVVRQVIPDADIEVGDALDPLEAENVKMRAPLDSSVARRMLDWSPQWPLEHGVREYADRFRRFVGRGERQP